MGRGIREVEERSEGKVDVGWMETVLTSLRALIIAMVMWEGFNV